MSASKFDKAALAANQGVLAIQKNGRDAEQAVVPVLRGSAAAEPDRCRCACAFQGEIVALMVFALFFGWALSTVIKSEQHPLSQVLDAIFQACMKIIELAMKLAPYAIFGIVFNTAYRMGAGFLGNVAYYALVVVLGLLFPVLRGLWPHLEDRRQGFALPLLQPV